MGHRHSPESIFNIDFGKRKRFVWVVVITNGGDDVFDGLSQLHHLFGGCLVEVRFIHGWNDCTSVTEVKGKVENCPELPRFMGNHGDGDSFKLGRKLVLDVAPGYDSGIAVPHHFFYFGLEGGDGIGMFC